MRRKASITVFAALSLMLVAQLLFTLLEAARHYELQKVLYPATNDGYDSDDYKGRTLAGLEIVMRSIIYAAYSN